MIRHIERMGAIYLHIRESKNFFLHMQISIDSIGLQIQKTLFHNVINELRVTI